MESSGGHSSLISPSPDPVFLDTPPAEPVSFGWVAVTCTAEKSFVSINAPGVVMTALKKASMENALIVRAFNIIHSDLDACAINMGNLNRVVQTDLNEEVLERSEEWTGDSVSLGVPSRLIVTLKGEVR